MSNPNLGANPDRKLMHMNYMQRCVSFTIYIQLRDIPCACAHLIKRIGMIELYVFLQPLIERRESPCAFWNLTLIYRHKYITLTCTRLSWGVFRYWQKEVSISPDCGGRKLSEFCCWQLGWHVNTWNFICPRGYCNVY